MSRLDEALARLERAVFRLEAARAGAAGGGEAARTIAEASIGKASIAGASIAEAGAEARRLRAAAGEIAARVDSALARVGRALGGGESDEPGGGDGQRAAVQDHV